MAYDSSASLWCRPRPWRSTCDQERRWRWRRRTRDSFRGQSPRRGIKPLDRAESESNSSFIQPKAISTFHLLPPRHCHLASMSLPSFPASQPASSPAAGHGQISITGSSGPGAGNLLPKALLIVCGVCSLIGELSCASHPRTEADSCPLATIVSVWSIILQLKGYRRPNLQRHVVRIMIMCVLSSSFSIAGLTTWM